MLPKVSVRLALVGCFLASACGISHPIVVEEEDGGTDVPDSSAPDASSLCASSSDGERKADLLFVIDNSATMKDKQQKLAKELPRLVDALTTGHFGHGSEQRDFAPIRSLHVGVVSSDMGTDGAYIAEAPAGEPRQCEGKGNDGLLLSELSATGRSTGCESELFGGENYLAYAPGTGTDAPSSDALSCAAQVGNQGCGLEQQLEAMHKALQPKDNHDFVSGHGHGDGKNGGFLRDDATLVVVHLSDEDDCSITKAGRVLFDYLSDDPRFYYEGEPANLHGQHEGLNFRCSYEATQADSATLVQPTDRFVDGLLALKKSPEQVVFAAIVGMPAEANTLRVKGEADAQDFAAILALEAMKVRPGIRVCSEAEKAGPEGDRCGKPAVVGGTIPPFPMPACGSARDGATPGRRFVQVAQGFAERGLGHNAMTRSICADDFREIFSDLAVKVSSAVETQCGVAAHSTKAE